MIYLIANALAIYDLKAPFNVQNGTLIGNWTMRSSTFTRSDHIRLTSSIKYNEGSLCQLVPTYARDWELKIKLHADGGSHGKGFSIFHTKEICTESLIGFNGIGVWINTSYRNSSYPLYVYNSTGDSVPISTIQPSCYVDISSQPTDIIIHKENNNLNISFSTSDQNQTLCHSSIINNMVENGFFSIAAATGENDTDNHDVYAVSFSPLSPYEEPPDVDPLQNKKVVDGTYFTRRQKKDRRRAAMKYALKIVNETREADGTLTGEHVDLINCFLVLSEAQKRGGMSLTADQMTQIISPVLRRKFEEASEVTVKAFNAHAKLRSDLKKLWEETEENLTLIAMEISNEMNIIREEALKMSRDNAKRIALKNSDAYKLARKLKAEAKKPITSPLPQILTGIAAVEFVAYVIFFIYQRSVSNVFKKLD